MRLSPERFFRALRRLLWLAGLSIALPSASLAADAERTHRLLTAGEIAGITSAWADPLPAVGKAAEELLREGSGLVSFDVREADGFLLPESLLPPRRRDPSELTKDDYPGWAGLLGDPGVNQWEIHRHLRTPAARAVAPQVAAMLKSRNADAVENAVTSLREMGAAEFSGQLAELLDNQEAAIVIHVLESLAELGCPGTAAHAAKLLGKEDVDIAGGAAEFLGRLGAKEFRGDIAALLRSGDPRLVASAMRSLAALHDPECVSAALQVLAAPDFYVPDEDDEVADPWDYSHDRRTAARILGEHGDASLGTRIEKLLTDGRSGVREAALMALAATNACAQAGSITVMLAGDQPLAVRREAVRALAKLEATEHAGRIARLLDDRDLCFDAVQALGKLRAVKHAAAIRAVMDGEGPPVLRACAAEVLLNMGALPSGNAESIVASLLIKTKGAAANWILDSLVRMNAQQSVEAILRHLGGEGLRRYDVPLPAVEALRQLGFADRCQEISSFLTSGDVKIRSGALTALRFFKAAGFSERAAEMLGRNQPEQVRLDALAAITVLQGRDAANTVAALLLPDESPGVLLAALKVVTEWGMTEQSLAAAALLVPAVSGSVKEKVLEVLVAIGGTAAVPQVGKLLTESDDPVLRRQAAEAIAGLRARAAAPAVAGLLVERDPNLRMTGLRSLAAIGALEQADAVAALLHDEQLSIRREAVRTLSNLKATRHAPALSALLNDAAMRPLVISALGRMGAVSECPLLFRLLVDRNEGPEWRVLPALLECGGEQPVEGGAFLVEAANAWPERRTEFLFACHFLFSRNDRIRAAIPWLGNRADDERPQLPDGRLEAKRTVEALQVVFDAAAEAGCAQTLYDSGNVAAEIIASAPWSPADAGWLESFGQKLEKSGLPSKAAAVLRAAANARAKDPLRRAMQWLAAAAILQPVCWILVWLIYPRSRTAQWMVWHRWFRRIAGFGLVGPLITAMPALRDRLWSPFREDLVPPGRLSSFDEWTFIDTKRLVPRNGGPPVDALRTMTDSRGVRILLGHPGSGRTTLLLALAASSRRPVALLNASECAAGILTALAKRLPERIHADFAFLQALLCKGSPDILVDALDDIPPDQQARMIADLHILAGGNFLIAVTSGTPPVPEDFPAWVVVPVPARAPDSLA